MKINQCNCILCILTIFAPFVSIKGIPEQVHKILIQGYVIESGTSDRISGVNIYDPTTKTGTHSDSNGFFRLSLPPGNVKLNVSHVSYVETKISLAQQKQDTTIHIYLVQKEKNINEIVVTNNKSVSNVSSSQLSPLSLDQSTIKNIPTLLGEADVIKALQTQPGISSGTEGFAGMYVRGGNGDDNLFMLDGNQLYQINHLGGLFSAFNTQVVKDVDFYKSSFPARFGGKLSSVIDIHTKDGDMEEYHGSASLGLISGSVNLEGPIKKNKTSFNVAIRRSWLELISIPALTINNNAKKADGEKSIGRYAFTDLNLKLTHKINERSDAYFLVYNGTDYLKYGEELFANNEIEEYRNKDVNKLTWGNILLSMGGKYRISSKVFSSLSVSYTQHNSSLKRSISNYSKSKEDSEIVSSQLNKLTDNGINDYNVSLHFNYYPNSNHRVNWGGSFTYHEYRPELTQTTSIGMVHNIDSMSSNSVIKANEASIFIEDDWDINRFLRVNVGIRSSLFNVQGKTYQTIEPRISARYALSDNLSLKVAYSRMSQFSQQIAESYITLPTDYWLPISKARKPLLSDQYAAGVYYNYKKSYAISLEAYYKKMKNLIEYKDGYEYISASGSWEDKIEVGNGRSYGAEILIHKVDGRLTGWIGYGLMWADRKFPGVNGGLRFPAKYDNRHKVNIVGNYKLSDKVELNASWTYMTGNRITLLLENYQDLSSAGFPVNIAPNDPNGEDWGLGYYDKRNNVRLPAYHRMDIGISIYRPKTKGRMGIWNISVYNLYSRMNPIIIEKKIMKSMDEKQKWDTKFRTLGILPILPSVSYTYKF